MAHIKTKYIEFILEHKKYNKFPLNSLVRFAKYFNDYKDFSRWYSIELNHGFYWHITDNDKFEVSNDISPRDMSSMSFGNKNINNGDLMITSDFDNWDEYYNDEINTKKRNYAVLFDASELNPNVLKQVNRGFGNEIYLNKIDAKKLKIVGVYDIETARKLNKKLENSIPSSDDELYKLWLKR